MTELTENTKLISKNFGGNLHATSDSINRLGLSDYVLAMSSSGYNTVVVFRLPIDFNKEF